jgi:hypothetical protein
MQGCRPGAERPRCRHTVFAPRLGRAVCSQRWNVYKLLILTSSHQSKLAPKSTVESTRRRRKLRRHSPPTLSADTLARGAATRGGPSPARLSARPATRGAHALRPDSMQPRGRTALWKHAGRDSSFSCHAVLWSARRTPPAGETSGRVADDRDGRRCPFCFVLAVAPDTVQNCRQPGLPLAAIWRVYPPVSSVSGHWPAPLSPPDLCRVVGQDRRADERGPERCSCCRLSATLDETLFSACREMLCLQAVICHHSWGRRRRIRHGQVAGAAHTHCSTWLCPGGPFTLHLPSAAPAGEERGPGTGVSARGGPVRCSLLGSEAYVFWFLAPFWNHRRKVFEIVAPALCFGLQVHDVTVGSTVH